MTMTTTKIDRVDYYYNFTDSKIYEDLLDAIPNPDIKAALMEWGIGDDLTLTNGRWIYDYESGGLLCRPLQEALEVLEADDEEWDQNYQSICSIAEAYAAYANALQTAK